MMCLHQTQNLQTIFQLQHFSKMKPSILISFFCLHTVMVVGERIRVYKHFWDSKNNFDVSAKVDINKQPATITVTKKDTDPEGVPVNFEGLCALLQEVYALRPSSIFSSSYIYLRLVLDNGTMRVSDIEKVTVAADENSVQIIWNAAAKFKAENDVRTNYLMDICDGGSLVGVYATESDEGSRWPDDVEIDVFQAKAIGTTIGAIRDRLVQAKQVYLGGPLGFQMVEHQLYAWTAINTPKLQGKDDMTLHLTGVAEARKKYWMKKFGDETICYEGELEQKANGKMEFRTNDLADPMLALQKIRNSVQDISTGKILLRYKSGLCISVSEKKSTVKGAIALPDQHIFGITGVDMIKGTKNILVSFDWLKNADGSSCVHAIKLTWHNDTVFLKASIYFDQEKFSGVAVVQNNKQCKEDRQVYLEVVHESLQKKMDIGVCTVEASGPLSEAEIDANGKYNTPLSLKVAKITDVGTYSFEIVFTE